MHGAYRRKFGPENVVELSKNIIVQHEDFLKQDDPDKKADALRYMAGYVAQYLHLVPQEKKFTFKETERVLHNSAMNIADFDPREASLSFRSLAKYAENLMEQPWRTDFHVIKLTSGFYVHNISAQLQNAHEVLIVLGYVNIDDTTLKLVPTQNYVNLKAVSRDCYIASQECLILSQIWQHVADQEPDYPLTIGEVFEYRKNHLGDTDTICNKLLYDIRARMHLVKQQQQHHQQYSHNNNQSAPMLKNSQRFVPVDRLIDYDAENINVDEPDNIVPQNHAFIPEREVDQTQELIKNVNLYNYNQDDEHLYDPVYGGTADPPSVPHHQYQQHQRRHSQSQVPVQKPSNNLPGPYFYNNSNTSRKSVPAPVTQSGLNYNPYQSQQYHNNFSNNAPSNNIMTMYRGESDGRNSMSPMIPKTVTNFFSNSNGIQSSGSRNNVSKSNSMNSISGNRPGVGGASSSSSSATSQAQHFTNQPLTRTKVKETDLDDPLPPRDNNMHYFNQVPSLIGGSGNSDVNRSLRSRKSVPAPVPLNPTAGNFPTQNQVYPDQYYPPGIVKPVAVYGSSSNNQFYMRPRLNSDNSEDVLNDAYAYASEVSQISRANNPSAGETKGQNYQHQATPIPIPGSDSDSHSLSSENKSRGGSVRREIMPGGRPGSSEMASSRDGSVLRYSRQSEHQRLASRKSESAKRPTHIEIRPSASGSRMNGGEASNLRYADSSPETDGLHPQQQQKIKNGYRELGSSSSGESPASPSARNYPRNEELSSLDTVYYDYLLKKGHTDEVMGNNSVADSHNSQPQREAKGTSSRTSSHHHHNHQTHNNYVGSDPEENHMYDGRRVVPKKNYQYAENDTRRKKQRNPVESVIPSASNYSSSYNDNLSSAVDVNKPSHDKDMRKSTTDRERRRPVENEAPSSSYSPPPAEVKVEPWDCRHCTFHNVVEERICEVCAKSKDFFEEDLQPQQQLAAAAASSQPSYARIVAPKLFSVPNSNYEIARTSGSSSKASVAASGPSEISPEEEEQIECPQCTLFNPKRARVCNACEYRFKKLDSPKNLEELAYDIR